MKDPYSVLGVTPGTSEGEIKKAYRELVRKYHPDNYHDNPLAELASEKMKEINEAYDIITKKSNGGSDWQQPSGGGATGTWTGNTRSGEFAAVREAISRNNLDLAEELLSASTNENAEWTFLMGSVYYRRGWLSEARIFYQRAIAMEPGNMEYQRALQYMDAGGPAYRSQGYGVPRSGQDCDSCDICTALMCANICCNCG